MDYCIICAHNEEETIEEVINKMLDTNLQLIVVDNASSDRTLEILRDYKGHIVLLQQPILGKAYALRQGIGYSLNRGAQRIITMDSDGEHKPEEMATLLSVHEEGGTKITIGNRFHNTSSMPNKDLIVAKNLQVFTGIFPLDPRCGARVYDRDVLEQIMPQTVAQNYGLETEVCYLALFKGIDINFHPISYSKGMERILIDQSSPIPGCLNGELLDLYRVFGRGDIIKGKDILNAHNILHNEFHKGDTQFGHTNP